MTDTAAALQAIADAPHLYIGVRTKNGPHVTPELFTRSGDRIVCLTAVSTLKSKLARKDATVAVAARTSSGSVAAVATATVIDPADARTALAEPGEAVLSPLAVARFVRDNLGDMGGAAVDALTGRLGVPPKHRVVLSLELNDAVIDGAADGDVVLGWTRDDGSPLALPARWDGERATVSKALFDGLGAQRASAACITLDETTGLGPSGKQGLMLRGEGHAETDGDVVRVSVDVAKTTWWDGIETGTVDEPGD